MRVLAPAKINLHLRVGRRSSDGFHPLLSWMCTVGLFDTLTIQPAPDATRLVEMTCTDGSLPTDVSNLVIRAAEALARQARGSGEAPPEARHASAARIAPVQIVLEKQIPIGGGLGGGSSDAAATLIALNRLWRTDCTSQQLLSIAATLGSDVPFFLFGPSSICTGRGELVTPIAAPAARFAVLILPGIAVSTAQVYRRFDELNLPSSNQIRSSGRTSSKIAGSVHGIAAGVTSAPASL
jgi:4-diphosphocytidyl-2-C-methyl-D-erythritol kinase